MLFLCILSRISTTIYICIIYFFRKQGTQAYHIITTERDKLRALLDISKFFNLQWNISFLTKQKLNFLFYSKYNNPNYVEYCDAMNDPM